MRSGVVRLVLFGVLVLSMMHAAAAKAGDPTVGAQVFRKCQACHEVGENARTKLGPVLNGLIGRKAGTYEGYSYSAANRDSGLVWDEPTLTEYLRNPRAMMPGTRMVFPGLRNDREIEDLIAYLRQFGADGRPEKPES